MNKIDISGIISTLVGLAKLAIPGLGTHAHGVVERWATIPAKQREKLLSGLSVEDKAGAETILARIADDISDVTVLIASRGAIEAD